MKSTFQWNINNDLVKSPLKDDPLNSRKRKNGVSLQGSEFRTKKVCNFFFFLLLEHSRGAKIELRARARWPDLGVDDATYCSGEAREEGLRMERRDKCRSAHLWQPKKNQHATGKRDFVLDSSCNGKALSGEPRTWDGLSVFTLLKTRAPGSKKLIGAGRKPREKAKKIRNAGRWVFFF